MNFEKCFCFDGDNMPNSVRSYTEDKLKLSGDVRFIKKIIILKNTNLVSHIKSRNAHTLFWPVKVSSYKYRNLYQRLLTTMTLTIDTQTSQGL
jgi:hypothetical protein